MQTYETVIGLEIHVQLSTASKAFCADDASFGGAPNTHTSAISLAHPGTLPRLNAAAVEGAVRLGLALGCRINQHSCFDRKNYFYADLPKGFQTTQDRAPICLGGRYTTGGASPRTVRIHHTHLEEDAGKSLHDQDAADSLIDLNRAGVPLLEIVTEPDLRSAEEVAAFMSGIRRLVRWLGISDGNMEEGSLRCDVNVSVRKNGETRLGQRCEIKNVNSMRFARRAIEYEVKRQIELLENGGTIVQETRGFDATTGTTYSLREKEEAHDYRYFPEPDLPPVVLSETYIEDLRTAMPILPEALETGFREQYGLPDYDIEMLVQERNTAYYFMEVLEHSDRPEMAKSIANLVIHKLLPWSTQTGTPLSACPVPPGHWIELLEMIDRGTVSATAAFQRLLPAMLEQPDVAPEGLAAGMQLIQSADPDMLGKVVDEIIAQNPDKVAAYRKGKKGLIGFFMGELMKASKGQADPKAAAQLLEQRLK